MDNLVRVEGWNEPTGLASSIANFIRLEWPGSWQLGILLVGFTGVVWTAA